MTKHNRNPLVSIVTPSYNQGEFIEETIQSVLNQDYAHIEYIVIDGGSTDNTVDILKKYDDKIIWVSEKDRGQTEAINKGYKKAKGEILGWINSDDTYQPGAIKKTVDYFKTHPDIKVVHGAGYYIDRDNRILRPYCSDPNAKASLPQTLNMCQPAFFIMREVIENVGLLDSNLHYCMDYEFIIRISRKYDIGFLDEYVANLRLYKGNKSSYYQKMHAEVMEVQRKYFGKVSFNQAFAYSNEYLKSKITWKTFPIEKSGPLVNLMAIVLSLYKYTQWNRKLPVADFFRWLDMKVRFKMLRR